MRTGLCHRENSVCIYVEVMAVSVLAKGWYSLILSSETRSLPATVDGVRYILVVTRQAVEKASGRLLDDLEFHEWVVENNELLRTIGDRVRPKPTAKGARVFIKSYHFS